ncbi:MAG: DUF177 domain-containing protein [Bacteroidales bacterium]|nr:DUF177 domain-containing protein [Bacteroidales bacterium]
MTGLYTIPLIGLKEGKHTFEFGIGNKFFDGFEESEIKEGELRAVVLLEKGSACINLRIVISGAVKISCDRCLEYFLQKIECENSLIVKAGNDTDNGDPEILFVPFASHELDLSQLFYEYIHLSLPLRRIHPDGKEGQSGCNPDMIARLENHRAENENIQMSELKKLLNNN